MRLFPRMKATGADMKRGWRIAGIFVTFHLVCLGWIFFRARDVGTGADILEQVFTNFDISLIPNIITGYWEIFAMMLVGYVAHFTPGGCRSGHAMPSSTARWARSTSR